MSKESSPPPFRAHNTNRVHIRALVAVQDSNLTDTKKALEKAILEALTCWPVDSVIDLRIERVQPNESRVNLQSALRRSVRQFKR